MSFFFGFPEFFTKCVVMEPHTDRYARSAAPDMPGCIQLRGEGFGPK